MAATFTIEAASKKLADMAAFFHDRTQPNKQIAVQLEAWVLRNFQDEGAFFGGWAPLKPSTILARLREGRGSAAKKAKARALVRGGETSSAAIKAASGVGLFKILQSSGALRQSYAGFSDNEEAGVGAQSIVTPYDLAAIHQEGTKDGRIPARPMLPPVDVALGIAYEIYSARIAEIRATVGL